LAAPNLNPARIAELELLVAQMEEITARGDQEALFSLNRSFHFGIYGAARRRQLQQIISQLWDQGDRYRRIYTAAAERAQQALDEHRAIIEACRRRDPDALGYSMRHHIHQTTVALLGQAETEGERL
jgi:DNA-binding GntR family transcriptional regulator